MRTPSSSPSLADWLGVDPEGVLPVTSTSAGLFAIAFALEGSIVVVPEP